MLFNEKSYVHRIWYIVTIFILISVLPSNSLFQASKVQDNVRF